MPPRTATIAAAEPTGLLTKEQVAQQLGVRPRTVNRWVAEGRLAYVRKGPTSTWIRGFTQDHVDAFIRENSEPATGRPRRTG